MRAHDVVVDCSDNFRTKFLINDAAVLARRPAIFASVYQYEGQIQVYRPAATHACLRCLWPDATADGVVGNCAEAGVLGPVPGAFGCLQALLTLKVLLGMPGQLDGELVLMDFMSFGSTRLKAPRRAECAAPDCALIRDLPARGAGHRDHPPLARRRGAAFRARRCQNRGRVRGEADAVTPHSPGIAPCGLGRLGPGADYLLLCASGKRSLTAARELRKRGFKAHSLAGGLQALEAAEHA